MSEGYAVSHLDDHGDGPGFRKIRRALGVTAFGVNAIVFPPRFSAGYHFHDTHEELYFLHQGRMDIVFGDGTRHELRPGSLARVDAQTVRRLHNPSDEDAVVLIVGGKDGYVGRDAHVPEGETSRTGGPTPSSS